MCIRKMIAKWRACRAQREKVPATTAVALFIAIIALALVAGVARWSWLLMDEQLQLRRDFTDLKSAQDQLNIQFEFWSDQLQKERAEIRKLTQ